MDRPEPSALSGGSRRLIELGDTDALLFHVNGLISDRDWPQLGALREGCRDAVERGKQLWSVAAHIEYRLCLQGPADWAAWMLETASGRFALGPLPEVAASTHTWAELAPHLTGTPQAAMAAHERVLHGEDLADDPVASRLPEVLEMPLKTLPWEPAYALAEYHPEKMGAPPPAMPLLGPVPSAVPGAGGAGSGAPNRDEVSEALEELVNIWSTESNGRVAALSLSGDACTAVEALGSPMARVAELSGAEALALMAWAAASGGAHGRRRGAAAGRFAAWWVVGALGDLSDRWPAPPEDMADALGTARWYAWEPQEISLGWSLRLALEVTRGNRQGRAWALSATDQV